MNFIKSVFIKLGSGLLYGIGFMIAVTIAGAISYSYMERKAAERAEEWEEASNTSAEERRSTSRDYDKSANLVASVTKERIGSEEFILLGKLENKGDGKWSSVTLKAELFNEDGDFIDECSDYIRQASAPGSTVNFKLSCGSCSKVDLSEYKSYELIVIDAHHSR